MSPPYHTDYKMQNCVRGEATERAYEQTAHVTNYCTQLWSEDSRREKKIMNHYKKNSIDSSPAAC